MRVSLTWLKEFLPNGKLSTLDISELTSLLDMTGTAVEAVEITGDRQEGVVIGRIVTKERHPEADSLWITTVDIGAEEPLQIVCGAQNFEAGDKVPVAVVGAVLPGGITIKKSKLRGVVSFGMNCSAKELGVGGESSGLLILPQDAPIGALFSDWHGATDTILDLEITPNRADCLSMVGVAREIGAVLEETPLPVRDIKLEEGAGRVEDLVRLGEIDPDLCRRYCVRVIKDIKVGPSPAWLSEKVESAGARSINNVVDATNYILFEMGQPLHAFDLDKLRKGSDGITEVSVRRAGAGEHFTTLDGIERNLETSMAVISDSSGSTCLAGVMGGENSEVDDETVTVMLESAAFDPAITSRTSRVLSLISESSLRFERGVDATQSSDILDRAAALIADVAQGTVVGGKLDSYPVKHQPQSVELRASQLEELLGISIPLTSCAAILTRLGFGVTTATSEDAQSEITSGSLLVEIPAYRPDVEREVDLIEEVLRIWGMDKVPFTLPAGRGRIGGLTEKQKTRIKIGATLRACGLTEAMSYPFSNEEELEKVGFTYEEGTVAAEVCNPMSSEQSLLRPTLLPGLLHMVSLNRRHGVKNVALYEMGSVFVGRPGSKSPKETEMIAGVLCGSLNELAWNSTSNEVDFYDAKGILEQLAATLGITRLKVAAGERPWLQPGRAAEVLLGKDVIGWVGEIHPLVGERFETEGAVIAFEVSAARLLKASTNDRTLEAPQRFPAVELDVALVVDEGITAETVEQRILSFGKKAKLASVKLFDVYTGSNIAPGKKSLAYKLSYRDENRTLSNEEVEKGHEKLLARLEQELGAQLR